MKVELAPTTELEIFYRVDGFEYFPEQGPHFWEMPVIKKTPKGVWICPFPGTDSKKFVLLKATKRYACPTKKEALESFIWRKRKHIQILKKKLELLQEELTMAEEFQGKEGAILCP